MSSPLRDALNDLDHGLTDVRLPPAASIRALAGRRRRRSRTAAAIAAVATIALSSTAAVHEFDRGGVSAQPVAAGGGCPTLPAVDSRATTIVYLTLNSTTAERSAIEQRLATVPGYLGVTLETRTQAWARFTAQECDAPEIIAATKPGNLRESLWVATNDRSDWEAIKSAVAGLAGVDSVLPREP
ncbi:permease-like cell division protein FtsX [Rugosimonospora africana]|uniref:FtsX extracellular domain-containing protein n=1 Tax=Rugosimonospora africana TaxID=556532 RepID=A0A8J3VW39_9ACTN|nr:permease-like cell division protein FtsX [Rugosimonospora africana]GIH20323.1 hypothetical protein Raf01_84950 [Rugosimonospora africana]